MKIIFFYYFLIWINNLINPADSLRFKSHILKQTPLEDPVSPPSAPPTQNTSPSFTNNPLDQTTNILSQPLPPQQQSNPTPTDNTDSKSTTDSFSKSVTTLPSPIEPPPPLPSITSVPTVNTNSIKEETKEKLSTNLAADSAKAVPLNNTNVFPNKANSTNAIGKLGPWNYSVSTPPFVVKSCDQILLIIANTIPDDNDYANKKLVFFTMNIYLLNIFESPDNNKLINSIYLTDINRVPSVVKGTKDCVGFNDDRHKNVIYLCYEKPEEIINAFNSFVKCRSGSNLKSVNLMHNKKMTFKKKCREQKKKKNGSLGKWTPTYITKVPGS